MKRDPKCTLCSLHKTAEHVCLLGEGPKKARAMIIGEAPGAQEDESGRPFVGRAGRVLDRLLDSVGLSRDEVFVTNAVSCRPPDNRTPKKTEIEACKKWLTYQIEQVDPEFLLLLGNVPLQSVLGLKGVKKFRGRPIEHDDMTVLPTFHPSYVLRDERQLPRLEQDFRKFKAIIDFGGVPEERSLNITIVDTWKKVEQMLDAMHGVVSGDIETTCLYPWAEEAEIVSLGFGTRVGEFCIPVNHRDSPWSPDEIEAIIELCTETLEDCICTWQAGKFDLLWMLVHYDVVWRNDFDTMLAHYLLDENSLHDVEHMAKLFYGAHDWDVPLEEKQGKVGSYEKLAKYHAHDLHYTRKLFFTLSKALKEEPQVRRVFERIMMPIANLFVHIEHHGCYVDTKRMGAVEKKLRHDIAQAEGKLKQWGDINWGSPKQVADLLYGKLKIPVVERTPKGAASTSESCLKRIDHPAVEDLLKFRAAKQQLSFFIEGWKPYIHKSRIHPSFKLHGTVTGRLSCEHPNFQQVPRDPLIRSLVTAPKGWQFVEGDLSQIELRVVAEMSKVSSMMKAFRDGVDIHWLTCLTELSRGGGERDLITATAKRAQTLRNFDSLDPSRYDDAIELLLRIGPDVAVDIDKTWKEFRKKAKAVNFGYVFGMWWKKFKIYARDNYDLHLTDEQAQESREAFFDLYPLDKWHQRQRDFARQHGYVRSLSGRKRRLPHATDTQDTPERAEAWRQAINSPVQSFANELNLMCLLQLSEEYDSDVFCPVMTVHDQVGAEIRNDAVTEVCERWEEIMKGPDLLKEFDISLTVPICGEVKIGPWGSGVSLQRWKEANR